MDSIKALMNKKIFRSREEHHDRNLTRFAVALAAVLFATACVLALGIFAGLAFLLVLGLLEIACWILPAAWTALVYARYRISFIKHFVDSLEKSYDNYDKRRDRLNDRLKKVRKEAKEYGTRREG